MNKQGDKEGQEKKTVTRYEQKLEKRKIQAKKDKNRERAFRFTFASIVVLIVAVIAVLASSSAITKHKVANDVYIKVGEHEISKLEFDYYAKSSALNFINTNYTYLSMYGFDPNVDYSKQPYSDTMTWNDAFEEMGVTQLKQVKALTDDAGLKGLTFDTTETYKEFTDSMKQGALTSNTSENNYYKYRFGTYATKANVKDFVNQSLFVEAYYEYLAEVNAPSDEEVSNHYEENKNKYDTVSYRTFAFHIEAEEDASEQEISEQLEAIKNAAESMLARRQEGEEFNALCEEYASEENRGKYQDAETDASLTEDGSYDFTSAWYRDWLFEITRNEGDVALVEEEGANRYHVVEFIERSSSETALDTIKNTLTSEVVSDYIENLTSQYEVVDVAGKLVYLQTAGEIETEAAEDTIDETTTTAAAATTEAAATTAATEAAAPTQAPSGGAAGTISEPAAPEPMPE